MKTKVKILNLEDNALDSQLIQSMLEKKGVACELTRVETEAAYQQALQQDGFDLIIADYNLPSFDGVRGLGLARQFRPEIPFIFFSGVMGEDNAVESLHYGATDYVLKQRPARLVPAVQRALQEAEVHRQKQQAEAAMRESEERFRTLAAAAQDAIILMDNDGKIAFWNRSAEKMFGYSEQEIMGKEMHRVLAPPRYHEAYRKGFAHFRETGEGVAVGKMLELAAIKKDGTEFPIELSVSARNIRDHWFSLGILRDITERKLLEKQFQQAQKMETLGHLAGGVAHDFNNMIQAILGFGEIMLDSLEKQDTRREDMLQILDAARRAQTLTRQLLGFSRKQEIEPQILNANEVLVGMEKMLRRLIGEDIKLAKCLAPDLAFIKADPGQLEQAVMNLVVNARDAMPKGGSITLTTGNVVLGPEDTTRMPDARAGRFVKLAVTDTGTGISPEVMQHLFEPFFTTKGDGKGTGLGLAVVYGVGKQNAGWVSVESQVGQGSTFTLYLPVADTGAGPSKTAEKQPATEPLKGHDERILLVEDEEAVRRVMQRTLRLHGYEVREAGNAKEALQVFELEQGRFDLVLTDVIMPDQDGMELAFQLRTRQPDLRVLLISGYCDDRVSWAEIKAHGFHFLQKPYSHHDLCHAVRKALERPSRP